MLRHPERLIGCVLLVVAGVCGEVFAQDPTRTLPHVYTLQFDNDVVRVVRVHYPPGETLPEHTHTGGSICYVYLNDADAVRFVHEGGWATTRPPVKTGALRLSTGGKERHSVENTSATPADYLRIELKTIGNVTRQRIARPVLDSRTSTITVEHESERLLIQRVWIPPGQSLVVEAAAMPALWIAIPSGETRWADAGRSEIMTNTGSTPMEFVRMVVSR